jgi:hypothetical protein
VTTAQWSARTVGMTMPDEDLALTGSAVSELWNSSPHSFSASSTCGV